MAEMIIAATIPIKKFVMDTPCRSNKSATPYAPIPKNIQWPNDTIPVYPSNTSKLIAKIAKMKI